MPSYLDQDREEFFDDQKVIDDKDVYVDVYRIPTTGTRPGFEDDVGALAKIGTIQARIERWGGQDFKEIVGNLGITIELTYVGLTSDSAVGVQKNDEWHYNSKIYKVMAFDDLGVVKEILLKQLI
jgi:hypothetical protein